MLVEPSCCKPFPLRILLSTWFWSDFPPECLLSLLDLKRGDNLTVPHLPRKMNMKNQSGTDSKSWLNPSTIANFLPVEVYVFFVKICFNIQVIFWTFQTWPDLWTLTIWLEEMRSQGPRALRWDLPSSPKGRTWGVAKRFKHISDGVNDGDIHLEYCFSMTRCWMCVRF